MRTSSVVVSLAIAAAAAPALAYPVSSPITRRGDDAPTSPVEESGAAINWGHVLTGASIGIPIIGGIIDHFTNKNNGQKREVNDLLELLARADVDDDESAAAIKWGNVLTGVSIGMPIIGGIIDHFTNKNNGQKRDVNELLELLAREEVDDESAAAIKWGNVLTGASIGIPIIGGIIDHFTNKNNGQKRDFDESGALAFLETLGSMSTPEGKREFADLLARVDVGEDSEAAIDFYKAANWGSAVNNIFNIVNGIYTHIRDKRELDELLARADDDEAGAAMRWNAEQINGITSLAYYGYNMLSGIIDDALHKKGKRDLAELIARASEDDTVSAALALGLLGHLGSAKTNVARSLNELD